MTSLDEYIIKYCHGGTLVKEKDVKYENVVVCKFSVDPNKLFHWDILGDVKELGYDISKDVKLFYVDGKGVLKIICDDETIVGLIKQLMVARKIDVYVEIQMLIIIIDGSMYE